MKRILPYLVPIALLIFFILVMNGGDYLKKPRGTHDDFNLYMSQMITNVENSQWQQAGHDYKKLGAAWKKIIPRIQFSVEKDEITAINVNFARLEVYLSAKDKEQALAELKEARLHWTHLNN